MSRRWKNIATTALITLLCLNFGGSIDLIHSNSDEGLTYVQNTAWTYTCDSGNCIRERKTENKTRVSLETCSMLCATPLLWPKPTRLQVTGNGSEAFNKNHVSVQINALQAVKDDLKLAVSIFMNNLPVLNTPWLQDVDITNTQGKQVLQIKINVENSETKPQLSTNESYSLSVKLVAGDSVAEISATSYFGARHGLETLGQLIWYDTDQQKLKILHNVEIYDRPAFPHRGIMIDTARNYFPIERLLKVLDGMAASKLNVLHLHLTDYVSFSISLPNNRKFAFYGAYGPEMMYTPEDIKKLIEYARIRGIRVILEINAPGHTNEGWNQWHENENEKKLIVCEKENIFSGQLNPDNKKVQSVLQSIYSDLLELGSDRETFHIGGDEINLDCWRGMNATKNFKDVADFWADFTNNMFESVKAAFKDTAPENIVLWSSPLTEIKLQSLNYSRNIVIQHKQGEFPIYLRFNHKVIFSDMEHWNLDCGFGPWNPLMKKGACGRYITWQTFYKYRPWAHYPNHINKVLGGETVLWSHQVEVDSLETRIWPRAAAVAERLWSDPVNFKDYDVSLRLANHRERLIKRGVKAAAMWPRWCYLNPGRC